MNLTPETKYVAEFTLLKANTKAWQRGIAIALAVSGAYCIIGFWALVNRSDLFEIGLFIACVIILKLSIIAQVVLALSSRGKLRMTQTKTGELNLQIEFRSGGIEFYKGDITCEGQVAGKDLCLIIYSNGRAICTLRQKLTALKNFPERFARVNILNATVSSDYLCRTTLSVFEILIRNKLPVQ
ncbi:MAG: hypothetical protein IAF38_08385 [Bacteroidia bacterium]|nr:hypothetical protein [Bacteroidia bacterium]